MLKTIAAMAMLVRFPPQNLALDHDRIWPKPDQPGGNPGHLQGGRDAGDPVDGTMAVEIREPWQRHSALVT